MHMMLSQLRVFIGLMLEGSLDRETTLISRKIIDEIKNIINGTDEVGIGFYQGMSIFLGKEKLPAVDELTGIIVNLDFHKGSLISVEGSHNKKRKGREVEIDILAPYTWEESEENALLDIANLIPKLKETIRHELEHVRKGEDVNRKSSTVPAKDVADYYLSKDEIEAHVVGFYKRAKMEKRPVRHIFDEKLRLILRTLRRSGVDRKTAETITDQILDSWMGYVKQRFPRVKL